MSASTEVALRDLSFTHEAATEPLFSGITARFPEGFTGIVGANGVGKTTLLELLLGLRRADAGELRVPENRVYCAQRTDAPPERFDDFMAADDAEAWVLRGRLSIEPWRQQPWAALSHGERKRIQIAAALWQAPDLLAIDEPTNHIDAQARDLLLTALQTFRGVCVIVSHDRELLDLLCGQCLWLTRSGGRVVAGGYSAGREVVAADRAAAVRARDHARSERDRLLAEQSRRREVATASAARLSKRGIAARDHDAKGRIDAARLTGKGTRAGRLLQQLSGRLDHARARLATTQVDKEYELGIWVAGARSRRRHVLRVEAGSLPLPNDRLLMHPQLLVGADQAVAVTGANGIGKSSLLRALVPRIKVAPEHLLVLPQEVSAPAAADLLDAVRALPSAQLGEVMQIVSRLGSRPGPLLASRMPSPGEVRKLLLALGILRQPHLIVMDEPTNHLDLPSIEALQQALAACPCAMLLVSHDRRFLSSLTDLCWCVGEDASGQVRIRVDAS